MNRIITTILSVAIAAVTVPSIALASGPLTTKKVKAFEKAFRKRGCNAIPYERARRNCRKLSKKQDRYCKAFKGCGLDDALRLQREIQEALENMETMVEGTTAHRENKAVVDRLLRELDKLQRSARPSKTMAKRCRKARINVQSHFKLARRKVRSEKGEGHAKFRQHRDYIDRYFGREEPGHAVQIRNMQNAIDNCSRVLRLEPR